MKVKMKLCIITPTHWSAKMGGAEYQAKCLVDKLVDNEQFEIHYLAGRYAPEYHPKGYEINRISKKNGIRRYGYFYDLPALFKLLDQIKPSVIYQRVGCAYTGVAAYYAKRNKCTMVWHIALDTEVMPFQRRGFLSSIIHFIDKKILEYGIKNSQKIIAQTQWQGDLLKNNYKRKPTAIIPNFQPIPTENINKSQPLKIVWVANLKPVKQPEYFVRLAKDLDCLGQDVKCVMIGAPAYWNQKWQRSFERKISEIDCLTYLGMRPIEDVNHILASSHIFVNTSYYEGFPNTFIQAWMRKVPVVSLHSNPDGIIDRHGLGFFCGTYEEMLAKILELIKKPSLRDEMGKRAQAYAYQEHSEKNIFNLIEILQ